MAGAKTNSHVVRSADIVSTVFTRCACSYLSENLFLTYKRLILLQLYEDYFKLIVLSVSTHDGCNLSHSSVICDNRLPSRNIESNHFLYLRLVDFV